MNISVTMIGEWSLRISAALYFIWFMPQILLTFRYQSTDGLSIKMHGLLLLGYCADLIYGFGLHMPWLYRAVTLSGLLGLLLQQWQFFYFNRRHVKAIFSIDACLLIVITALWLILKNSLLNKTFFDCTGFISVITGFVYAWPQIIKNHRQQSAQAISLWFIIIALFTSVLDMASAVALGWDWPSKIGPLLALFSHGVLLWQSLYLTNHQINVGIKI
ncbi:MAG: PQ-loop repeat-containing protein [Coxiellaceae bacterium]|nr:PQ-loop repeat-containing protein [Coxiellaceae bacterium]